MRETRPEASSSSSKDNKQNAYLGRKHKGNVYNTYKYKYGEDVIRKRNC